MTFPRLKFSLEQCRKAEAIIIIFLHNEKKILLLLKYFHILWHFAEFYSRILCLSVLMFFSLSNQTTWFLREIFGCLYLDSCCWAGNLSREELSVWQEMHQMLDFCLCGSSSSLKQRDYDTGLLRIWVFESKLYLTALIANSPGKSHMLLKSLTLAGHGFTNEVCILCFSSHRCFMYSVLSLFFFKVIHLSRK